MTKLSDKQIERLYRKAYIRLTTKILGPEGMEYGLDFPTLKIIAPTWANTLLSILREGNRRSCMAN